MYLRRGVANMQWEILSDLIREQIPNLIIRETVLISKDTRLYNGIIN